MPIILLLDARSTSHEILSSTLATLSETIRGIAYTNGLLYILRHRTSDNEVVYRNYLSGLQIEGEAFNLSTANHSDSRGLSIRESTATPGDYFIYIGQSSQTEGALYQYGLFGTALDDFAINTVNITDIATSGSYIYALDSFANPARIYVYDSDGLRDNGLEFTLPNSNAEGIAIIDGHIAIQYQNNINYYTPSGIRPPSDLNLTGYDDIDINSNNRLMLLNSTDGVINLFNFAGGASGVINLPDSTVFAITKGDDDTIYALREVDDGGGGTDITVVSVNAEWFIWFIKFC